MQRLLGWLGYAAASRVRLPFSSAYPYAGLLRLAVARLSSA